MVDKQIIHFEFASKSAESLICTCTFRNVCFIPTRVGRHYLIFSPRTHTIPITLSKIFWHIEIVIQSRGIYILFQFHNDRRNLLRTRLRKMVFNFAILPQTFKPPGQVTVRYLHLRYLHNPLRVTDGYIGITRALRVVRKHRRRRLYQKSNSNKEE